MSNVHTIEVSASDPFDPANTIIRFPEVEATTGLARATIYKRLKDDPTFSRPAPLSNSKSRGSPVGLVLAEVFFWVNQRIALRGEASMRIASGQLGELDLGQRLILTTPQAIYQRHLHEALLAGADHREAGRKAKAAVLTYMEAAGNLLLGSDAA